MLAHVESLIGGVNHKGVIFESALLKVVEHPAHVAVDGCDYPEIVAHILAELPFVECLACESQLLEVGNNSIVVGIPCSLLRCIHIVIHVATNLFEILIGMYFIFLIGKFQVVDKIHVLHNGHFLRGGCNSAFIVVVEILGERKFLVAEEFEVACIRHPCSVRCLVVQQQTEFLQDPD